MNIQQAPEIKANGDKMSSQEISLRWGKAIRPHELETAFAVCLGDRDFAMYKIMMFLTGNAEGFRVAEKTIIERCNISESGYKNARKKLVEKGWLTLIPGKEIIINYEKIYEEYRKSKGFPETTP